MQKVLRINLNARNQGLQKARRKHLKDLRKKWAEHDDHKVVVEREMRNMIKTERKQRREDWLAGPLAPKRDVGLQNGIYGTLPASFARGPEIPDALSRWPKSRGDDWIGDNWTGKGNEGNLVEGDRVCVARGSDAVVGQIGKIKDIARERGEITLDGLNMADMQGPPGQKMPKDQKYMSVSLPIPIDDVRLVFRHTEKHPVTGRVIRDRDVLVESIQGGAPYIQREDGSPLPRHTRYITGSDLEIPWPSTEPTKMAAFPGDTRRFELEKRTYTPSVQHEPLPHPSIIDELRPKYRIDRLVHESSYVARKIVEDARSRWYEARGINTPAMELQQKVREHSRMRAEKVEVPMKLQILLEEQRLLDFLPSYREKMLQDYKQQGAISPEVNADIDVLAVQNNSLSTLVDTLLLALPPKKTPVAQELDELEVDDAAENEDIIEEEEQEHLEEELVVHELPTKTRR